MHTSKAGGLYGGLGAASIELVNHCSRYLGDQRYEQVRADLRRQLFQEWRSSTEAITPFALKPEHYRRLFDLIIQYYTRVRDAVIGMEEIWAFLIESVFNQELKGNLIFEQYQKQLFRKEVLQSHRYLLMFIKEINDAHK
jgi:predicted NACHT family NTPase